MNRKTCFAAATLLLAALMPAPAQAGVEPSPFHVLVTNRSDIVASDSPFYLKPMAGIVIYAVVEEPVVGAEPITRTVQWPATGVVVPAGGRVAITAPETFTAGRRVVGWGFTARMGIDPSPFHQVYAMEGPAAEAPATAPILPPSLIAEAKLYAFASPGTEIGEVIVSNDTIAAYCPADAAWKNHGQYVRCVAFRVADLIALGELTESEADAVVSAAARSQIGK